MDFEQDLVECARRQLIGWMKRIGRAIVRSPNRATESRRLEATLACTDPVLLMLDEPWEGLDPDASRWLSDTLARNRAAGSTIVVSSHRIHDLASICDRSDFIDRGRVAAAAVSCSAALSSDDRVAMLFAGFDQARGLR